MKFNNLFKRMSATVLSAAMVISSLNVVSAAQTDMPQQFKFTYQTSDGALWEKISHPDNGPAMADGIVDYIRYGSIGVTGVDQGANGQGDRGQSYSYCSATYGDWVYINTMYGGLGVSQILARGMEGVDAETALAAMNVMYNGHLYTGEADKCYAGGMLFKFNVKTGETKILMSRNIGVKSDDEIHRGVGMVPTFRYALEYNGKLYFVGMAVDTYGVTDQVALNTSIAVQKGRPCVYAVDPKTDELTRVYEYDGDYKDLDAANIFTSTRAFGTYKGTVIAGGLGLDAEGKGEAFLVASNTPDVPGSYKQIAGMADFDNLPAVYRQDVNGGGGIYQVIEYNNDLYVVVCTGSVATTNKETGTKRSFAIYRGKCNGDATLASSWTWEPVVGDMSKGAKYTYGIDPSRVSCGACTLVEYDGYLYIGDYNDVSSALQGFVLQKQFTTQATNLEQSINMYRMDKNENIELVVGDATEMFPKGGISGIGTGYGNHMNQYTWQTIVHDGKLYISTMDTTTLLEPIAQFTNGDLLNMSEEEWQSQIDYIKTLIQLIAPKSDDNAEAVAVENTTNDVKSESITEQVAEEMVEQAEIAADGDVELTDEQVDELVDGIVEGDIASDSIDEEVTEEAVDIAGLLDAISKLVETTDIEQFTEKYADALKAYLAIKDELPDSAKGVFDMILSLATKDNLAALAKSVKYMKTSVRGFDLYTITDNTDGSVKVDTLTLNGFGDPYNHGLRIFAETQDYFIIGTANPFYGTQLWRTKSTKTVSPSEDEPIIEGPTVEGPTVENSVVEEDSEEPSTQEEKELVDNSITLKADSYKKTLKSKRFNLGATANNAPLTYTSANEKVVKVDADGNVSVVGTGMADIIINSAETDTYKAATKTVNVKVVPAKAVFKSIKPGKNNILIKWKKLKGVSGYQIQIAKKKSFKKATSINANSKRTFICVKNLNKKTNYYVRIRGYKTIKVDGKKTKLYGSWSKVKNVVK